MTEFLGFLCFFVRQGSWPSLSPLYALQTSFLVLLFWLLVLFFFPSHQPGWPLLISCFPDWNSMKFQWKSNSIVGHTKKYTEPLHVMSHLTVPMINLGCDLNKNTVNQDWLVVEPTLWKICNRQIGFIFTNFRGENEKSSEAAGPGRPKKPWVPNHLELQPLEWLDFWNGNFWENLGCKWEPIGSMYGIFTYIWLIFMVNVGKYTIHGWCGE